jgi:hypothetical protein
MTNLRKKPPVPHDQYFTPQWVADLAIDVILPEVKWETKTDIGWHYHEPCAGRGVFVRAMRRVAPFASIDSTEMIEDDSPTWAGKDAAGDVLLGRSYLDLPSRPHGLILTNPPFGLAREFIELGRREIGMNAGGIAAYLLRLDFASSAARAKWLRENPPAFIFVLPNRPRFGLPESYVEMLVAEGWHKSASEVVDEHGFSRHTDSRDYGFFVWTYPPTAPGQTRMVWLPEVPSEKRR